MAHNIFTNEIKSCENCHTIKYNHNLLKQSEYQDRYSVAYYLQEF